MVLLTVIQVGSGSQFCSQNCCRMLFCIDLQGLELGESAPKKGVWGLGFKDLGLRMYSPPSRTTNSPTQKHYQHGVGGRGEGRDSKPHA